MPAHELWVERRQGLRLGLPHAEEHEKGMAFGVACKAHPPASAAALATFLGSVVGVSETVAATGTATASVEDEGVAVASDNVPRDDDCAVTASPADSHHEVPSVTDSGSFSDMDTPDETAGICASSDGVVPPSNPAVSETTSASAPALVAAASCRVSDEEQWATARARHLELERRCGTLLQTLRRQEVRLIRDELDLLRAASSDIDSADVFGFGTETLAFCENSVSSLLDVNMSDLFEHKAKAEASAVDSAPRTKREDGLPARHRTSPASVLLQLSPKERSAAVSHLSGRAEFLECLLDPDATDCDDEDGGAAILEDDPENSVLSTTSNRWSAERRLARSRLSWLDMRVRALGEDAARTAPLCGGQSQALAASLLESSAVMDVEMGGGESAARARGLAGGWVASRAPLVRTVAMPPRARNPLAVFANPAHRRAACVDSSFHPTLSAREDVPGEVAVNLAFDSLSAKSLVRSSLRPSLKEKRGRRGVRRALTGLDEEGMAGGLDLAKGGRKRPLSVGGGVAGGSALKKQRSEPPSLCASMNGGSLGASLNLPSAKKRKEHSAWDFDNIVIPTSMASIARIE
eukprot:Opistho-2@89850